MENVFDLYLVLFCSFDLVHSQLDEFTTWNFDTPMVEAQSGLMAAFDEATNKIWLIGGLEAQNEIWQYDIVNNSFIDNGNISLNIEQEWSKSYATDGNYIYFPHYDILYRFNMANGILDSSWNRSFLHPNISAPCLSMKDNRYIFILGGTDESINTLNTSWLSVSTFQIYDILSDTWHTGNPLNIPREWYTCEISPDGNWFYAFGGVFYDEQELTLQFTQTFEKLDISDMSLVINGSVNNGWQLPIPNLLLNNFYHQRSTVDFDHNLIYLIGGFNGTHFGSNVVQIFNPLTDVFTISFATLNIGRLWPTVIYVKQKVYVFGGDNITPQNSYEISNHLPTNNPTKSPTVMPTITPTITTNNPSISPVTYSPTQIGQTLFPSISPTKYPTSNPSISPTLYPSLNPSINPSISPTLKPTQSPLPMNVTRDPSISPTFIPSNSPSSNTYAPTQPGQTLFPSSNPSISPTKYPSVFPSQSPIIVTIVNTESNDGGKSSTNDNNSNNIGLIIGFIIGGIILFGLLIFVFFCCKQKSKKVQQSFDKKVESIDLDVDGNYTIPHNNNDDDVVRPTSGNNTSGENVELANANTDDVI